MKEERPIKRLSEIPWLVNWAKDMTNSIGGGIVVDVDGGLIIPAGTTTDELKIAAHSLMTSRDRSTQVTRVIDRMIGMLIFHHAANNNISWAEAIEELNLCETDGRSLRSLSRLPRIVSRLDAETLMLPDLTTKHFDQATAFQPPESAFQRRQWDQKVKEILIEASLDPTERGSSWVTDRMKALQVEMGIKTERSSSASDVLRDLAICSYVLGKWTEEDFKENGTERGVVADHYEALMGQAIIRCMIPNPDEPSTFVMPWKK